MKTWKIAFTIYDGEHEYGDYFGYLSSGEGLPARGASARRRCQIQWEITAIYRLFERFLLRTMFSGPDKTAVLWSAPVTGYLFPKSLP